MIRGNLRK